MNIITYNNRNGNLKQKLLERTQNNAKGAYESVQRILIDIKKNGLNAVLQYANKFDGFNSSNIKVSKKELAESENKVTKKFKVAVKTAAQNINKFHKPQIPKKYSVKTMNGIRCFREFRPIEKVGFYIPGGTAVLPSTLLMLGIPARLAGVKRIVVCSPTKNYLRPELLFVAKFLGITEVYKIGGVQAIGLMAYGTSKIEKVDKIYGPGNQFVNIAKSLVNLDPDGPAIDMIAGPSEVLIIADGSASPSYVAADLLAQAEHGNNSAVVLCTTSKALVKSVIRELNIQQINLSRRSFMENSLNDAKFIIFKTIDQAIQFSNEYAPEHLLLHVKNPERYISKIINAGSVFLGENSPESVGDYASGTNHSLPTGGNAKTTGGISVEQFMKGIMFQRLTKKGLKNISATVIELAHTEGLEAHAQSLKIRLQK